MQHSARSGFCEHFNDELWTQVTSEIKQVNPKSLCILFMIHTLFTLRSFPRNFTLSLTHTYSSANDDQHCWLNTYTHFNWNCRELSIVWTAAHVIYGAARQHIHWPWSHWAELVSTQFSWQSFFFIAAGCWHEHFFFAGIHKISDFSLIQFIS